MKNDWTSSGAVRHYITGRSEAGSRGLWVTPHLPGLREGPQVGRSGRQTQEPAPVSPDVTSTITPGAPCPGPLHLGSPSAQLHPQACRLAFSLHSGSAQQSPCRSEPAGVPPAAHTSFTPTRRSGRAWARAPGPQHQGQRLVSEAAGPRGSPWGSCPGPRGVRGRAGLQGLCPLPLPLSWSAQTRARPAVPPLKVASVPVLSALLRTREGRRRGCSVGSWPGQPQESRPGGARVPEESRQRGLHSPAPPPGCAAWGPHGDWESPF